MEWRSLLLLSFTLQASGEVLKNGGFESLDDWNCDGFQCTLTADAYSGSRAVVASGRTHTWQGPSQWVDLAPGQEYLSSAYMKVLSDQEGVSGQQISMTVKFELSDGSVKYVSAATYNGARVADGWVKIVGSFAVPDQPLNRARIYFQKPHTSVDFAVDEASVVELDANAALAEAENVINSIRKSDINIQVRTGRSIRREDVEILVTQTRKAFPFGTAANAVQYNSDAANGRYRDFIHNHFNWAVTENSLKWKQIEWNRGVKNYQPALDMVNGLRDHGLKVRGHALVWSVEERIQDWVKQLEGQELRDTVEQHITEKMALTNGLLEHWDVNNENLHGTWFQDRLNDPDYNLELFRIARRNDPNIKLFLNDFHVVSEPWYTNAYRLQGLHFKQADVGFSGMGAQCHFSDEKEPNPALIKQRLDALSDVGVPIWATELDVSAQDENARADYYEKALKSLYGHPAVQGILLWGFWDQAHWRGENAALAKGENMTLTAAGVRVLDLLENHWMTRARVRLTPGNQSITIRGFHGSYNIQVFYRERELNYLARSFDLGPDDGYLNIDVWKRRPRRLRGGK